MDIETLRERLGKANIKAHATELSEHGVFLVYFEQGSFTPELSPKALRQVEGIATIEQKSQANPHIFRITVKTDGSLTE
jgi:hypothetical protein